MNGCESMNPKTADSRKRGFFDERAEVWDEISVHNL
jgi:hypothetical protein